MLNCITGQGQFSYGRQAVLHDHARMNFLHTNLKFLIDRVRITENALATETGVDQSQINRMIKEKIREPRDSTIRPIADRFSVSIHDLKYVDLRSKMDTGSEAPDSGQVDDRLAGTDMCRIFAATEFPISPAGRLSPLATSRSMPVSRLWLASCVDAAPSDVRFAFAHDDSMQGEIEKGDVAFIDTTVKTVESEGIFAFTYFGVPHIKRGQVVGKDSLRFTGTRPYTNSIPVEGNELEGLVIIGKIFASLSQRRF